MNKRELESRLIDFVVNVIGFTESLGKQFIAQHLSKQLLRSSTSAALNYGEACSGESRKDFIHKMQLSLKELRETSICLRIIEKSNLNKLTKIISEIQVELNELIAIFVSSIKTAKDNS